MSDGTDNWFGNIAAMVGLSILGGLLLASIVMVLITATKG